MAKSQETWNKKELEKKKGQKRKEKEQRKEERKANKGSSSFDDMIAYVDENGNFSSTPPDPMKKRVIKESDIQVGVPRKIHNAEDNIRKGVVTFFNTDKGYGFIKDMSSQESIFVHVRGLVDEIRENDKVTFETEMGPKGLNAYNVAILKA
jgi:cold shock CspA family protein